MDQSAPQNRLELIHADSYVMLRKYPLIKQKKWYALNLLQHTISRISSYQTIEYPLWSLVCVMQSVVHFFKFPVTFSQRYRAQGSSTLHSVFPYRLSLGLVLRWLIIDQCMLARALIIPAAVPTSCTWPYSPIIPRCHASVWRICDRGGPLPSGGVRRRLCGASKLPIQANSRPI